MGNWEGNGLMRNPGGDIYMGAFVKCRKKGQGRLEFFDGRVFEGEFKHDKMVKGHLKFKDGSYYRGQFKRGRRNGYGVNKYEDGSTYDGEWKDDVFQVCSA
jgi:hypothetical protein